MNSFEFIQGIQGIISFFVFSLISLKQFAFLIPAEIKEWCRESSKYSHVWNIWAN